MPDAAPASVPAAVPVAPAAATHGGRAPPVVVRPSGVVERPVAAAEPAAAVEAAPEPAAAAEIKPSAEAAPVVPPKPAEDPKAVRAAFERNVQREKNIQAERQKLAQEKAAVDAERAAIKSDKDEAERLKRWQSTAKTEPLEVLKGLFGDQWKQRLSEVMLDEKAPADLRVDAVRDEIKALKDARESDRIELAKEKEARARADNDEQFAKFKRDTADAVKRAGDKYKAVNALGYHEHVVDLIQQHWQKQIADEVPERERVFLSVEESAAIVEEWAKDRAMKVAALYGPQVKPDLTTPEPAAKVANVVAPDGKSREARTLTAALTATLAAPRITAPRTEAERTKAAIAAYEAKVAARKAGTI